jgi:hypothetical protein
MTPVGFTTIPIELITEIFCSLDNVGSAARLSQTSQLMYGVWLENRSTLSVRLLWTHPLFWNYQREDEGEHVPEGLTLIASAEQLERLRQGK